MTTIILVTIGILLAAASALMVVFHGGDAFHTGTVKAQAATVVNKLQGFAAAMRAREMATGQRLSASDYATNQAKLVEEGWLSGALNETVSTVDANGYASGRVDHIHVRLSGENAKEVCRRIDEDAHSPSPDEVVSLGAGWSEAVRRRSGYGCFDYGGTGYYAFFRV